MKSTTVKLSDIMSHPTGVLSAQYWIALQEGKLPFIKQEDGSYICSHVKDLANAIYMTEEQAIELNLTIAEYQKAKALVKTLLDKYNERI